MTQGEHRSLSKCFPEVPQLGLAMKKQNMMDLSALSTCLDLKQHRLTLLFMKELIDEEKNVINRLQILKVTVLFDLIFF